MTRVYLVRHGTHDLVNKALAGRMPGVHLGPTGRDEAVRLAKVFAYRDVTTIVTSPLERCRETAAPIAERLALDPVVDDRLIEIDCGTWTGVSFDQLAQDPEWGRWNSERQDAGMPGGETMVAVQRRVMGLVESLASEDREPAILVSHADVLKAAVMALIGMPLRWHDRIVIDPASVTTVDLWPGGGKVVRLNEGLPA